MYSAYKLNKQGDNIQPWIPPFGFCPPKIGAIVCVSNFYAEYIMRNTGLEEAQAGIKIAGRNINNLRYADDTILMAESKRN